jgi:single-strand DNA-binding protein
MNQISLIGRLTRDPELKYMPNSGIAVSTFTLAVDKGLSKDKKIELESKNQPTADFIRIVAWGKLAETVANYLTKCKMAGISGRIQTGSYTDKDGKKVFTTDVVAQQVSFLEWGDKQDAGNSMSNYDMDGFHPIENENIPF